MGAKTLAGKLIEHFERPFAERPQGVDGLRDLCESGFERDMFDELRARGYKIRPQFPCGGYRIDFVAESMDGSRLAIECDGDRWHGPGRWQQDMARQRVLERAGWTFWRCFASDFARRRDEVMASLEAALAEAGVKPWAQGSDAAMVERREVVALAGVGLKSARAGAAAEQERGASSEKAMAGQK